MAYFNILLADNDTEFVSLCAEFLEAAGYRVLKAIGISGARQMLETHNVHLAILDLRLTDDRDEKDKSGLMLAKEFTSSIPKLILTKFPTHQDVREAMKWDAMGLPAAVDYVDKRAGLDGLLSAVKDAIAHHVRINWDLVIDWKARDRFALVNLIEPDIEGERLLNRAEELEDLFRRLFHEKSQIRIDRLLWQREGRVALTVFAFKEGAAMESCLVVCGQNEIVSQEARRYREAAPAPGDAGTVLTKSGETTHFAANVYTLTGDPDLQNLRTLAQVYRSDAKAQIKDTLDTLFQETLAAWQQKQRLSDETKTLDARYRERLSLTEEHVSRDALEARIQKVIQQSLVLGVNVERAAGELTIRFDGQSFQYPDPVPWLYMTPDIQQLVMLIDTPGTPSGENILIDEAGRTWLTDFASAGPAPLLWNFVAVEAIIRFDLVEVNHLRRLHEMEQRLVDPRAFSRLDTQDVDSPIRRALKTIQTIRGHAQPLVGKEFVPYHRGIFFHAASRLVDFNPVSPLTPNELARMVHVLMAMAMIGQHFGQGTPEMTRSNASERTGIWIDLPNQAVYRDGKRISMRGQSYALLCFLFGRANQLCTRRDLIEQGLKDKYSERDANQINRLNTAIDRLREKIEVDPNQPRYLITDPGGGYRLVPNPPD